MKRDKDLLGRFSVLFKNYFSAAKLGRALKIDTSILRNSLRRAERNTLRVPYEDYFKQNYPYFNEISEEYLRIFQARDMQDLKEVSEEFEREFARYCASSYAVGVSSGTSALVYSLLACGVKEGDEVITSCHSYVSTALAITDVGARPVFTDIGSDYNIDPSAIESRISARTKAVIPVHIYGNPADMDAIIGIASGKGIAVIEDASQAHGASIGPGKAGTFGAVGCFSFNPSKIMGGLGNAGIAVTNDKALAARMAKLREPLYDNSDILLSRRTPAAINALETSFLRVKLRHIEEIIAKRKSVAGIYEEGLKDVPEVRLPRVREGARHVYRNYTVEAKDRDGLLEYLLSSGIEARIFYRIPLHLRKEFSGFGYAKGDFPVCEAAYQRILSLPCSESLAVQEAQEVVRAIRDYYGR